MEKIKGLVAAAYTPMNEDGTLAPEKLVPLVEYSITQKFAALFIIGSTGEFTSLTTSERETIADGYVQASAGKIPIILNVGSCSLVESIALARHGKEIGADAICTIAPFYFRPDSVIELAAHLKTIAKACAPLPFFLYHVPGITSVNLSMRLLLELVAEQIPNFAGMKFTDTNLMEYQRCVDFSDRFQILFGKDEMLLGALAMGATAGVGTTYNYLPRVYNNIIESFNTGDMETARKWQAISQAAVTVSCRHGLATIKKMMVWASGIDIGPMRSPVHNFTPEEEKAFRYDLEQSGVWEYIG